MYSTHPLSVAPGEVVVDCDDVDALAFECVQIHRHRRYQGLSFTRTHLSDCVVVQCPGADHLDVVVALPEHPLGRLAYDGERFGLDVLERLAIAQAVPEFVGLGL